MANRVEPPNLEEWEPKTKLGQMVKSQMIYSYDYILKNGYVVKEPEIVKLLVPNLEYEVLEVRLVQKMTDSGRRTKFRALVVVGNRDGLIGAGVGKAREVPEAINKALNNALLNLVPVKRGCGSWECGCGTNHSLAHASKGSWGSVEVTLRPGPRGLGIVAGETAKKVIQLAGVEDVWAIAFGETRTPISFAMATYDALRNTYKTVYLPRKKEVE